MSFGEGLPTAFGPRKQHWEGTGEADKPLPKDWLKKDLRIEVHTDPVRAKDVRPEIQELALADVSHPEDHGLAD